MNMESVLTLWLLPVLIQALDISSQKLQESGRFSVKAELILFDILVLSFSYATKYGISLQRLKRNVLRDTSILFLLFHL